MGQDSSLIPGTRFTWKPYRSLRADWDHDHCAMCQDKFVEPGNSAHAAPSVGAESGPLTSGYATTSLFARGENDEWVCASCYEDFAEEFQREPDTSMTT